VEFKFNLCQGAKARQWTADTVRVQLDENKGCLRICLEGAVNRPNRAGIGFIFEIIEILGGNSLRQRKQYKSIENLGTI